MKIKMLSSRRRSPDGFEVIYYEKGKDYEIDDRVGAWFVWRGWAVNLDVLESQKQKNGLIKNPETIAFMEGEI